MRRRTRNDCSGFYALRAEIDLVFSRASAVLACGLFVDKWCRVNIDRMICVNTMEKLSLSLSLFLVEPIIVSPEQAQVWYMQLRYAI